METNEESTERYYYHKRIANQSWLLKHIEVLLEDAIANENVSHILYACLECRNLLEKIEFELLLMSTIKKEWPDLILKMKGKTGIQNANKEFKTLKYRLQTFSECISKISDLPVKAFDYRQADIIQRVLSEYVHIYTRTPEELSFGSEFIQVGIRKITETLRFVKSYFVKHGNSYNFGCLNFETLNGGKFLNEFRNWKSSVDTDTDALYGRLKTINDNFYEGSKARSTNN